MPILYQTKIKTTIFFILLKKQFFQINKFKHFLHITINNKKNSLLISIVKVHINKAIQKTIIDLKLFIKMYETFALDLIF